MRNFNLLLLHALAALTVAAMVGACASTDKVADSSDPLVTSDSENVAAVELSPDEGVTSEESVNDESKEDPKLVASNDKEASDLNENLDESQPSVAESKTEKEEVSEKIVSTEKVDSEKEEVKETETAKVETSEEPSVKEDVFSDEPKTPAPPAAPKVKKAKKQKKVTAQVSVPSEPVLFGAERLNRFYILRKGDTPEKLAELIYGNLDKKSSLTAWNSKPWKTGEVVYFVSPLHAEDGEMHSFFEERGIVPAEYEVKAGDTLVSIAEKTYGDKESSREVAMINKISDVDGKVGTQVVIYPADLSGYSAKNEVAKTPIEATAPVVAEAKKEAVPEKDNKPSLASASADSFFQKNVFLIGAILTLTSTLLYFLFFKKRRDPDQL